MIYRKSDGTRFVLAYHSPDEWADVYRQRLIDLGCSPTYASRVARSYRQAELSTAEAKPRRWKINVRRRTG
jgi:hypothetical protein